MRVMKAFAAAIDHVTTLAKGDAQTFLKKESPFVENQTSSSTKSPFAEGRFAIPNITKRDVQKAFSTFKMPDADQIQGAKEWLLAGTLTVLSEGAFAAATTPTQLTVPLALSVGTTFFGMLASTTLPLFLQPQYAVLLHVAHSLYFDCEHPAAQNASLKLIGGLGRGLEGTPDFLARVLQSDANAFLKREALIHLADLAVTGGAARKEQLFDICAGLLTSENRAQALAILKPYIQNGNPKAKEAFFNAVRKFPQLFASQIFSELVNEGDRTAIQTWIEVVETSQDHKFITDEMHYALGSLQKTQFGREAYAQALLHQIKFEEDPKRTAAAQEYVAGVLRASDAKRKKTGE
jgi:hypothetical protein